MVELIWDNKDKMLEEVNSDDFLKTDKHFEYNREESKNFDTTENLYIEGDNLEALKLLQKNYQGKIKMIYIDPPYNTEKKFIYNDTFRNKRKKECRHSGWLNMIYPRLKLSRDLLTDDGAIFISIDDNEVDNLKKVCDEIFGENNFVNKVVWVRNSSGKTVNKQLTVNIEYLLIYSKSEEYKLKPVFKPLSETTIKSYSKDDNDGRGKYCTVSLQKTKDPGPETTYDYIDNLNRVWKCPAKGWRMIKSKVKALENDGRLYFDGDTLRVKMYWNERTSTGKLADTLWDDMPENSVGSKEVSKLFDNNIVFSNPKPTKYIERLLEMQTDKDSIVMDFFSGSSSTAHSVIQLNAKDNGKRKYIMIQIPEKINEKEIKLDKLKYKTICEIGKERIRRAGDKIVEENKDKEGIENLDIGFKVIKIK